MKHAAITLLLFAMSLPAAGANSPFGERLSTPATVQVVNNLTEDLRMIFSDGPFINVFGVGENGVIAQTVGRGRSVNAAAVYGIVFVYNRNFLFILHLQDGNDYIVRLEGEGDNITASLINMTVGTINAVQPAGFWD